MFAEAGMKAAEAGGLIWGGEFNELTRCWCGPMLYNRNDQYVGRSLQLYGEYSKAEWDLFAKIVGPGMTVIEVGANIGAHTIPLALQVGPTGKVIAFEPQRLCFQLLCANAALNQLTNVVAHPYAVSVSDFGRERTITMPVYEPRQSFNFGGVPAGSMNLPNYVPIESVPVVSLDEQISPLDHCRFLKLDVEGWEADVLRGAQALFLAERPVIYCENDRRDRSEELVGLLRSYGYDLYWHLPPLFNPLNYARNRENVFPNVVSINMLCMPAGVRPPVPLKPVERYNELW